jgi:glycogen debranching enzyme
MSIDSQRLWNFAIEHLRALRRQHGFDASEAVTGEYATLFGRDSLWVLIFLLETQRLISSTRFGAWVRDAANDVLVTLAMYQGTTNRDSVEEQPGKIMHEIRLRLDSRLKTLKIKFHDGRSYSGFDQTFLFVIACCLTIEVLGDQSIGEVVLQAMRKALKWIDSYGDEDGDGLFEYRLRDPSSHVNQTWRDSFDSIVETGISFPQHPISWLCVQAYAYKAWRLAAGLYLRLGDREEEKRLLAKAAALAEKVAAKFWLEDEGCFAIALDATKEPIHMISSDAGHALWSGIVDSGKIPKLVERLQRSDLMTAYGVRTLSSNSPFYAPFSYHRGNIWPFDNTILMMGLFEHGYDDGGCAIARGVATAIDKLRSPYELYIVLDSSLFVEKTSNKDQHILFYRHSNQPNRNQAWTAAGLVHMAARLARVEGKELIVGSEL